LPCSLRLLLVAVALSLVLGCSSKVEAPVETSTPAGTSKAATSAPTATATPLPKSTRPGVSDGADLIINTVLAHDGATLETLTKLTPMPCGAQAGPGSPPACPAGAANGTNVEVLPVASCEGELRPKSAVRGTLYSIVGTAPSLVAVYKVPSTYMPQTPGDTLAVFSRHPTISANLAAGLLINGNRVVAVVLGCQATPAQIVPSGATAVFQS
jgi:hypothetical protein